MRVYFKINLIHLYVSHYSLILIQVISMYYIYYTSSKYLSYNAFKLRIVFYGVCYDNSIYL